MIRQLLVLLFAFLVTVSPALARASTKDEPPADSTASPASVERNGLRLFPPKFRAGRVVGVPKASYSSERGLGLGGEVRFYLGNRQDPGSRIDLDTKVTTKGQVRAELVLTTDLSGGRYTLKTKAGYDDLSLRYYGLGPGTPIENEEIYQPQSLLAYVEAFRRVSSKIKVGLRYEYENTTIAERERDGLLDTTRPRGIDGGTALGAGLSAEFDTRDRRDLPTTGSYFQGFAMVFDDELGSDYDFNVYNLDLRQYFSVSPKYVLATQFFMYAAKGSAPFWRLAALGGRAHTRGYRKGRNLDNVLYAFQGEFRITVWKRFGVVAFGGMGDVASTTTRMELEHMKPTLGGGLRYNAGADHLRARFDMAFGNDLRFYLGLGEAF